MSACESFVNSVLLFIRSDAPENIAFKEVDPLLGSLAQK
jgi:hypothetical protein